MRIRWPADAWREYLSPGRFGPGARIVTGAVGVQALQAALFAQAYGAYLPVLQADLQWSATVFAAAFSLLQAIGGLMGPLQGRLLTQLPAQRLVRFGLLLLGLSFLLLATVTSQWAFFATFVLIALGYHLAGFLTLTTIVVNSFEHRRSLALALMQLGVPVGGLALPLVALSLSQFGWRMTAAGSGLLILLSSFLVSGLLAPRSPSAEGPEREHEGAEGDRESSRPEISFSAPEALRTPAFWLIALGHAVALMLVSAVNVHAVVHMNRGVGLELPTAAAFIGLMTFFTLIGQVTGGLLGDLTSKRMMAAGAMLLHGVALLLLARAQNGTAVALFAVLHGLAWGVRGPLMQALRADYFGRRSFSTIMGYSILIVTAGAMAGPLLAGLVYDLTGDYAPAFTALAALAALGSVFFLFAARPLKRS